MRASQLTFRIVSRTTDVLAIGTLLLAITALFLADELVLPWYSIPTYVKAPLFLEYFSVNGQPFGLIADQILVWQHYATGSYTYLAWPDYVVFATFFVALVVISVTLTYLHRSWYLFCAGLVLLAIMQLNLPELGLWPDYISYLSLIVFGAGTYYFQSIKTSASLALRTWVISGLYLILALAIGFLAPSQQPNKGRLARSVLTQ